MADAVVKVRRRERMSVKEYVAKLVRRGLGEDGKEKPDPTPMAPPVGWHKQPSMIDIVRQQIASHHLSMAAQEKGYETFEEADDFDVEDDPIPQSPHEIGDLEPVTHVKGRKAAAEKEAAEKAAADAAAESARKSAKGAPDAP